MKTQVAETSLQAYRSLQAEGKLPPQCERVVAVVAHFGALTREEIAERSGLRLSAVCGRVSEMLAAGRLQEDPTRTRLNRHSGKANKLVTLPMGQLGLFS